jgi:hypothetical protein
MKSYESLDDALSDLREKGYKDDFTTGSFCLYCGELDMRLDPDDFHVDEINQIEGSRNADNPATLYAISSSAGIKGTLVVDADGIQHEHLNIEVSKSVTIQTYGTVQQDCKHGK